MNPWFWVDAPKSNRTISRHPCGHDVTEEISGMKLKILLAIAALALAFGCSSSGGDGTDSGSELVADNDATVDLDAPQDLVEDLATDGLQEFTGVDGVPDEDASDPDVLTDQQTQELTEISADETETPDGMDVAEDLADVEDSTSVIPPYYESPELGIKILGPSATGSGESIATQVHIAGIVMGQPDYLTWESQNGQEGYGEGTPYFLTTPVQLIKGDNTVTVTAHKGDETVSDTIVITHNPVFMFGNPLMIRPGVAFVGQSSTLLFSLDMGLYSNFDPATLTLCQTGPDGECESDVHAMVDDGQVGTSGDEVAEDGVYSWKKVYNFGQPGNACFRVHAAVFAGYQQHMAYSPVVCVDVVARITQATCQATQAVQTEAQELYDTTLASGTAAQARQAVLDYLAASESVTEYGESLDGTGIWARYNSGILGAFSFPEPGNRSGTELVDYSAEVTTTVMSKESVVLSPAHADLGDLDEASLIYSLLASPECPPYVMTGAAPLTGANASLSQFRDLFRHGIVALTGHGDSYFKTLSAATRANFEWWHPGSQELIWTGQTVDCGKFVQTSPICSDSSPCPTGSECVLTEANNGSNTSSGICVDYKHADLQRGRMVMGSSTFGILPTFITRYRSRGYPKSVVYLGSCRSFWNGTMALAFYAAGARAVLGYSNYVSNEYAYQQGTEFFQELLGAEKSLVGAAMPPQEEDPANPGTRLRLLGDPYLNASDSELINPSWETGDLTGWLKTGDGRVVSRLGITLPVEGKFMSLISTGMGFTPQVGEIYQTFCIPEDKVEVSFYWKYYSEEFQEYCGSSYQDTFEATIESDIGNLEMASVMVDDLCPSSACSGCGGQYVGLIQSDVEFDIGDVWNTSWQKVTKPAVQLAGKGPVVMRFYATDKGDSIYDTVILIDAIRFK